MTLTSLFPSGTSNARRFKPGVKQIVSGFRQGCRPENETPGRCAAAQRATLQPPAWLHPRTLWQPRGGFGFRRRRIRKSKASLARMAARRAKRYTPVCASAGSRQAGRDRRRSFRTKSAPHLSPAHPPPRFHQRHASTNAPLPSTAAQSHQYPQILIDTNNCRPYIY